MVTARAGDRAQLILVGSVAVAAIVVGLVVVLNGMLYTEATSSSGTVDELGDAEAFDYEARRGVRSLLLRLNHRHRNASAAELGMLTRRNVTGYGRLLGESYASSQAGYVSLSYRNDSSAMGSRLVQAGDAGITTNASSGDRSDWEPVPAGREREIGWFTLNADVRETETSPTRVTVANETGAEIEYTINRSTADSGVVLNVTADPSYGGETTVACDPSRGRVLLDFLEGRDYGDSCSFEGVAALGGPYAVSVSDGSTLVGKYELVVNESVDSPAYTDCRMPARAARAPADEPCTAPVVWTANVTTSYRGSDVAYGNSYNVSVYGVGR